MLLSVRRGPWRALTCVALVASMAACSAARERRGDAGSVWSLLRIRGAEIEHYADLKSMFASADAVVWASVGSVEKGRLFGDEQEGTAEYLTLTLDVKEEFVNRSGVDALNLEFLMPDASVFEELRAGLAGQEGIFFLGNKGAEAAALGQSKETQEVESAFWRFVNGQGFFLDAAGTVVTPLIDEERADFTKDLEGIPFADLLEQVRALS